MLRTFYKEVEANTEETDDYIIPAGEFMTLGRVGGNSGFDQLTVVRIEWDALSPSREVIFSTHADGSIDFLDEKELVGDGIKVLRIALRNDQGWPDFLGGYWRGN